MLGLALHLYGGTRTPLRLHMPANLDLVHALLLVPTPKPQPLFFFLPPSFPLQFTPIDTLHLARPVVLCSLQRSSHFYFLLLLFAGTHGISASARDHLKLPLSANVSGQQQ